MTVAAGEVDEVGPGAGLRRWLVLIVAMASASTVVLDTTSANVAIPSIGRDLGADLSSVLWIVTGYSLTFAGLLVVGGRLGDLFGHRRTFIVGAGLFATGSLVSSFAPSLAVLLLGRAVIQGAGAALMLPATIAVLSTVFEGRDRALAFAAWGTAAGGAAAFGPVLGGFLTSTFSWRWSFRANVITAVVAIIGAVVLLPARVRSGRPRLEIGNALIASGGLFLVVFGITQGSDIGWLRPTHDVRLGDLLVWSDAMPVSLVLTGAVLATALLTWFHRREQRLEARGGEPLFGSDDLRHPAFRYGLLTLFLTASAQFGLMFVLPSFLQDGIGLSPGRSGLWQLPMGLAVLVGAPLAGHLSDRIGVTTLVRIGVALQLVGTVLLAAAATSSITFARLLPCLVVYGAGLAFVTSQLTNLIVSGVAARRVGVAGGATMTLRQVGAALGVSVVGVLLSRGAAIRTARPSLAVIATVVLLGAASSFLLPGSAAATRTEVPPAT